MLRALIGERVDADPGATAALAPHCGGVPLALRVAAEFVISRPMTPLADAVGDLTNQAGLATADHPEEVVRVPEHVGTRNRRLHGDREAGIQAGKPHRAPRGGCRRPSEGGRRNFRRLPVG